MSWQEYTVVFGLSREELTISVNNHLDAGWELQGGVAVGRKVYYQAMTRMEKDEFRKHIGK